MEERLAEAVGALGWTLEQVRPLHGGACQENFLIRCAEGRLVLRSDANQSLPGSLGRAREAEAIRAAVEGGVPTPAVRTVLPDLLRNGATAVLMDFAPGIAIGAKVVRMEVPGLVEELARALAAIHAIRPAQAPSFDPDNPQDGRDVGAVEAALRFCRSMMGTLPPRPAMERALAWLEANRPDDGPLVLVHGDYRVGNFLVGEDGLEAVLDWEFAHWGSAAEDLSWLTVRDWRFGRLDRPVGGLGTREVFCRAYVEAGGTLPDADTLRWWEVLGNLRWATGALCQTARVTSGAEADLELLAIGRRACEMEWEALRRMGVLPAEGASLPVFDGELPQLDDVPSTALLDGVAAFLAGQVLPSIEDRGLAFRVRIAAHLLGVVGREARSRAPQVDRAALAAQARTGAQSDATLRALLEAQLRVNNPRFSLDLETGEDEWTS